MVFWSWQPKCLAARVRILTDYTPALMERAEQRPQAPESGYYVSELIDHKTIFFSFSCLS